MGEHCSKSGSSGAFAFSAVHVTHDVELLKGEDAQRSRYVSDSSTSVDAFGAPRHDYAHSQSFDGVLLQALLARSISCNGGGITTSREGYVHHSIIRWRAALGGGGTLNIRAMVAALTRRVMAKLIN